jgi:hypothetical protein
MNKLSSAICIAVVLTTPVVALAHHAAAMFETEKTVTVSGTVEEFAYVNPHARLYVVVTDDKGEETLWGFEAEGPSALMRAGIKNNALQPGDLVTVTARPSTPIRLAPPFFSRCPSPIRPSQECRRPMAEPTQIALVEDDADVRDSLQLYLARRDLKT